MSIATMTRLAAEAAAGEAAAAREREGGPRPAGDQEPAAGSLGGAVVTARSDPRSAVQGALEAIAAYIPSEALAVYIAAIGILQPQGTTEPWVWLAIGLGLVVLFSVIGALDREVRTPIDKLVIVIVFGLLSFAAYAGALPGSPFLQLDARATAAAGVVALALSYALPKIARIVKVAPPATT